MINLMIGASARVGASGLAKEDRHKLVRTGGEQNVGTQIKVNHSCPR